MKGEIGGAGDPLLTPCCVVRKRALRDQVSATARALIGMTIIIGGRPALGMHTSVLAWRGSSMQIIP